ncbi:MAG: 2-iminoacetate synthase ThiH [Methanobrevibacter sp.]|jgi:2-iminoacetate synthase|nr:2-iminoacetate synthase ThiH [Methanobrevibacter sp.]
MSKDKYLKNMEVIDSDLMEKVLYHMDKFNPEDFNENDVKIAIKKENLSIKDFQALLSPAASNFIEEMAQRAKTETSKHFGNSISLFTPLYISNYCENQCIYCGFSCKNEIKRGKLSLEEIEEELKIISKTGLEDILLLTGESTVKSDLKYISDAVKLASKYFRLVGLEIYSLNTKDYKYLHESGADYVCIYQETYDKKKYAKYHLSGPKSIYEYRFNSQERAILGGMRKVGFGSLLGLSDFRKDTFATVIHGYYLQRKYSKAEISFSFLRLRPFINNIPELNKTITEKELLQVILATRIFMAFADITVSTRERSKFRNGVVGIGATKISAGVNVGVGGHETKEKGDKQFEILDKRSVEEIDCFLGKNGFQSVYIDHVYL